MVRWNVGDCPRKFRYQQHTKWPTPDTQMSLCWQKQHALLYSGSVAGTVHSWDIEKREQRSCLFGHTDIVMEVLSIEYVGKGRGGAGGGGGGGPPPCRQPPPPPAPPPRRPRHRVAPPRRRPRRLTRHHATTPRYLENVVSASLDTSIRIWDTYVPCHDPQPL